jgi:acyl carrier protein
MSIRQKVETVFRRVGIEQDKRMAPLSDDLPLLQTGLDSLCFALIVAVLEDELGVDPFTESEEIQLPVTFGDFVQLYENALKVSHPC